MNLPETKNPFVGGKVIGVDVSQEDYRCYGSADRGSKDFVMSRGSLASFLACPKKWRDGVTADETEATKWGTLIDTLVLTPARFDERFAVYPETYETRPADPKRTKGFKPERKPWNNNATVCREWKSEHEGKIFIWDSADDEDEGATYSNARRAAKRLTEQEDIAELIACSKAQVMAISEYRDKATDIVVRFKILLDLVPDIAHAIYGKVLGDFKTARDASESGFTKAVHKGFYDWQGAVYSAVYCAATGEDRTDFVFVVQENTPPYQPEIWGLPCDWKNDALFEVTESLKFYCWCLANNEWPGYHQTTRISQWGMLSREAWMLRDIPRPPAFKPTTPPPPPKPLPPQPRPDGKPTLHELEVTP